LAAPNYIFFSVDNRTAALRIPAYAINEKEPRVEFRMPDATGNPFLFLLLCLYFRTIDPTVLSVLCLFQDIIVWKSWNSVRD
jgi:hypothetical protein